MALSPFWFETSDLTRPMFNVPSLFGSEATFNPLVDVRERDKDIVVKAEIPGMKKEDIKVNFVRGALELSGEKSEKKKEKEEGWRRTETRYGKFFRRIVLPEGVDASQVKGSYKDGILKVTIPKPQGKEEATHRISLE